MRTISGTLPTDYTFTGQKLDASGGLMYYGARYYDAAIGRFAQPDSLIPDPYNPQNLNRYSYTLNNPLRYTDPTGHSACEELDCRDPEPSSPGADFYGTGDDDVSADTPADTGGEQQPEKGGERENGRGANPGGNRKNPDTWDRSRKDLNPRTIAVGGTAQGTFGIVAVQGNLVLLFDLDGNAALVWSPAGGVGVGGSAMIGGTVQVTNAENIDTVINSDHTFYMGASAGEGAGGGVDMIVGRDFVGVDVAAGIPFGPIPFETHAVDSPRTMTNVLWRGTVNDFAPIMPFIGPYLPILVFP